MSQVPRLQQIEAKIEEERVKHETKNKKYVLRLQGVDISKFLSED